MGSEGGDRGRQCIVKVETHPTRTPILQIWFGKPRLRYVPLVGFETGAGHGIPQTSF